MLDRSGRGTEFVRFVRLAYFVEEGDTDVLQEEFWDRQEVSKDVS